MLYLSAIVVQHIAEVTSLALALWVGTGRRSVSAPLKNLTRSHDLSSRQSPSSLEITKQELNYPARIWCKQLFELAPA